MEVKKNDKYKKKFILKQIEDKWCSYECGGDILLVKNCIINEKYNKIHQLVFNAGSAIDGLYIINSFDISLHHNEELDEKIVTIVSKKYDKVAGYDDSTMHTFPTKEKFIDWLIEKEYLTEEDKSLVGMGRIPKQKFKGMQKMEMI